MRITLRTFKMYMYYGTDLEIGKGNSAEFVGSISEVERPLGNKAHAVKCLVARFGA